MATPFEHAEVLALSMVARGEGTHAVEGHPEVKEAIVRFPAEALGSVEVTLRAEGRQLHQFRFHIDAHAPTRPTPNGARSENASPCTDEGLVQLRRAVELRPEEAPAWNDLGCALMARGRQSEAVPALEKAVALKPESPIYSLELGLAYAAVERYADAEKCHEEVVALDPKLDRWVSHPGVVSLIKLAQARWKQGQAARAFETLKPAIPLVAGILRDFGAYAMDAGNHQEAAKYLSAAACIAPDMEDAVHGAGRALLWIGRPAEALPWLIQAVAADATCTESWYDLGLAHARLGRRREARRTFRRALKRDPRHAGSWYDLGCLDALDGKLAAAFRNLFRAAHCGWNQVAHAQSDPDLVELRKDKRWLALVAAMQRGSPMA